MHRSNRRAKWLALGVAALSWSGARGEIVLLEGGDPAKAGAFHARLLYRAREEAVHPAEERAEIPGAGTVALRHPASLRAESAVLAVPGRSADGGEWQITGTRDEERGTKDQGGGMRAEGGGITIKAVQFGPVDGIQVTFDPDAMGMQAGESMEVEVEGPALKQGAKTSGATIALNGEARGVLAAVLNGGMLGDRIASSSANKANAPAPPGDCRITYRPGNGVVMAPVASLGTTTGALNNVALDHHGVKLPMGGVIGDSLWFYAPMRRTAFARTDSAFFTNNAATPSPAMASRAAFSTLAPAGTEVALAQTQRFESSGRYERFSPLPLGEKFFSDAVQFPASSTILASATLPLDMRDALTTTTVQLHARFWGANTTMGFTPDHYANVTLGGVALPQITWQGQTFFETTVPVTLASLPTGGGAINLVHAVATDSPVVASGLDGQRIDWVELSWTGYPRATAGARRLELAAAASPRRVTIGGFAAGLTASDVLVLDVTNADAPVHVTLSAASIFADASGGTAVEFEAGTTACVFYACAVGSAAAPVAIAAAEPMPATLPPSDELRGIYVRPPIFASELEPLKTLRGGSAHIVDLDPQAAYNAYNGGQEDPEAIKSALAQLLNDHANRAAFPSVLIAGHASLDPRDEMGLQVAPQVPCFAIESVDTEFGRMENPVDYPYTLLFGSDSLPDIQLGRIHARTEADLTLAVNRIVAHDGLAATLSAANRPGVFVADQDNSFQADQIEWAGKWSLTGNTAIRVDRPAFSGTTPANAALRAAMETSPAGAAFVMYSGHGSNDTWWNSAMMSPARLPDIHTENVWPLVATFTCLNGYYAFPGNNVLTMSEGWLFTPATGATRGAVANIAPVSVDFYLQQAAFAREVVNGFTLGPAARPKTAGELMLRAQAAYAARYPTLGTTLQEYVLFGDPATPLAMPNAAGTIGPGWAVR